jgi:hypothetical protein
MEGRREDAVRCGMAAPGRVAADDSAGRMNRR